MAKGTRKDWMKELGNRLAALLENGVVPWEQPWVGGGMPTSVATGKAYEGGNAVLLNAIAVMEGYTSNLWLTFNRAKQLGGSIRKGEKGAPVVWYQWKPKLDKDTGEPIEGEGYMASGGSWVWNLDQCDGIERESLPDVTPIEPPQEVTAAWFGMPDRPQVEVHGSSAHFSPMTNRVTIPAPMTFKTETGWYATLWHETAHWWTFNAGGLASEVKGSFGTDQYSYGELIAEMFAVIMMRRCGLTSLVIRRGA